jgi:hypothetical protein
LYLGWYDPDPKRPAAAKLAEAVDRYRAKFGAEPAEVLVGPATAQALADPPLPVRVAPFVPPHTFYVGAPEPGGG